MLHEALHHEDVWENSGIDPHILDYVIAQVVTHQALIKGAQVQLQASPCALVVDKVAVGQDGIRVLQFSPVSISPPTLHTKISFICHLHYTVIAVQNVKKQTKPSTYS